jgi:DNA polymerase delta subunit 2
VAVNSWGKLAEQPEYVGKILDTRADEICYMIGTIYIEMPQKPNVMNNLDDEVKKNRMESSEQRLSTLNRHK